MLLLWKPYRGGEPIPALTLKKAFEASDTGISCDREIETKSGVVKVGLKAASRIVVYRFQV